MTDIARPAAAGDVPFIVMSLVTSVTTLRERSSGTLERLLSMGAATLRRRTS
jgi:ABC-2 type transport system permease protein